MTTLTTDEIILMWQYTRFERNNIEEFARMVDAKATAREREACAKLCEIPSDWEDSDLICGAQGRQLCNDLARSIRARGGEAT